MLPKPNLVCPVCGEPNDCAPASSGSFDTPCWCSTVTIDIAAWVRVPNKKRKPSCLCGKCVTAVRD